MKEEGTACTHILQRESENMQWAGGLMHKSWEQQLLGLHTERERERARPRLAKTGCPLHCLAYAAS